MDAPTLSPRQLQAVTLIANGRVQKQAAYEMGITLRTVKRYLQMARERFNADTLEHLVALVVAAGLITIEPRDVEEWT